MPAIYFAGPDIFRPDYAQHSREVRRLCAQAGLTPLLPDETEPHDSLAIFHHNLKLIRQADGVIANLNPFRGVIEPDSGTIFECGLAFGLGKFVIGLIDDQRDMVTKLSAHGAIFDQRRGGHFHDGLVVENFGLPLNLMISHCLTALVATPQEAVSLARQKAMAVEGFVKKV